jgi:transglutaminase-like putative cysteine protease
MSSPIRYRIRHVTAFKYDSPVRFARCNLRLQPIDWLGQRLEKFRLAITPDAVISPPRPGEGLVNVTRVQIEQPARELLIESRAEVVVERTQPSFLFDDLTISETVREALTSSDLSPSSPANFIHPSRRLPLFEEIGAWCRAELDPDRGVIEAGLALALRIQREFRYDGDATGTNTSAIDSFHERHGVCQDFAQVMIAGCRAAGLPAAYVSGYLRTLPPPGKPRLVGADATHAWVMLWCGPESGWVGFDPTNGCLMAENHIVTAVGRDYADVAPVDGIFLGQDGQAIDVAVDVEPLTALETVIDAPAAALQH